MRALALLTVFISCRVFAVTEDALACTDSGTALDSVICSQPQWAAAEKQLQTEYDRLVKELKLLDSTHLVKDLVASQRTWLKFRQQYCDVYARSRVEGNSWTSYWEQECNAREARARAKALKAMTEQNDNVQ